jgi:prepilin-type N-terminal cleavage/methylation domain-containing protein
MSKQRNGFTLIELVVVILILGILAGVGAPKLFSTSDKATEAGVKQTLSVIRNAIQLYAADHGSKPSGTDLYDDLQDYLQGKEFPKCPVGNTNSDVAVDTTDPLTASGTEGWKYNPTTGEFICNSSATGSSGVAYSEL